MENALQRQYHLSFSIENYCDRFCNAMPKRHQFNLQNVHRVFAELTGQIENCLEIGSGPTVHHLISASRYCRSLVTSDLMEQNRNEISKWIQGGAGARNWKIYFEFVAQLEGYEDVVDVGASLLEERVRQKLKRVLHCDVRKSQPLGYIPEELFDVIISRACVEAACQSLDELIQSLINVSTLLKPGGRLILISVLGGDYYLVGNEKFPCLLQREESVTRALTQADLALQDSQVFNYTPSEFSNCCATLFTVSQKKF